MGGIAREREREKKRKRRRGRERERTINFQWKQTLDPENPEISVLHSIPIPKLPSINGNDLLPKPKIPMAEMQVLISSPRPLRRVPSLLIQFHQLGAKCKLQKARSFCD